MSQLWHRFRLHWTILQICKELGYSMVVEIEVVTDHPAVMSLDGQVNLPLAEGDRVRACRSPHSARFLRTEPPGYFYRTLGRRLVDRSG